MITAWIAVIAVYLLIQEWAGKWPSAYEEEEEPTPDFHLFWREVANFVAWTRPSPHRYRK